MDAKTYDQVPSECKQSKRTDGISCLFDKPHSSVPLALAVHIRNLGSYFGSNSKFSNYGFPCFCYERV